MPSKAGGALSPAQKAAYTQMAAFRSPTAQLSPTIMRAPGTSAAAAKNTDRKAEAAAIVGKSAAADVPGFSTTFNAQNSVNALRDTMQSQIGFAKSPFTDNMGQTMQHLSGEVGQSGIGSGQVAQTMVNRTLSNAFGGPGTPQYKNDLNDKNQWASIGSPNYRAGASDEVRGRVADRAIGEMMAPGGVAAPDATDFRAVKQKGGITTAKSGVDVNGNRFGNFEGVSGADVAAVKAGLGARMAMGWDTSRALPSQQAADPRAASATRGQPTSTPEGAFSKNPNYGTAGLGDLKSLAQSGGSGLQTASLRGAPLVGTPFKQTDYNMPAEGPRPVPPPSSMQMVRNPISGMGYTPPMPGNDPRRVAAGTYTSPYNPQTTVRAQPVAGQTGYPTRPNSLPSNEQSQYTGPRRTASGGAMPGDGPRPMPSPASMQMVRNPSSGMAFNPDPPSQPAPLRSAAVGGTYTKSYDRAPEASISRTAAAEPANGVQLASYQQPAAPVASAVTQNIPITYKKEAGRVSVPGPDNMQASVMSAWQKTLNDFGKPLPITSAYRSEKVNKAAKGAKKSQHLTGNAIDVRTAGLSPTERVSLISKAKQNGFTGFGVYSGTIHMDMGPPRTWGPQKALASKAYPAGPPTGGTSPGLARMMGNGNLSKVATAAARGVKAASEGKVDVGGAIQRGLEGLGAGAAAYNKVSWAPSGVIKAGFDKAAGPQIRAGAAAGINALKGFMAGSPATGSGAYTPPGGGGGRPSAPGSSGSRYRDAAGTSKTNGHYRPAATYRQTASAVAPAAPVGSTARQPMVYDPGSYFMNTLTREEALRRLLGEEWFA